MSSSSLPSRFNKRYYTQAEFDKLPRSGPDFLLDTQRIQRRLDARKDNPYRRRMVWFRVPKEGSRRVFDLLTHSAAEKFIHHEDRDGWELVERLTITGPYPYYDPSTGLLSPGDSEYRWHGRFRQRRTPRLVRMELDPATVKQDPEHRLTVKEAMKAWNVTLPKES